MISCQSTRKCRKGRKRYKVSRTKEIMCRRKMLQHKRRCGISQMKTLALRSDIGCCRTTSIRTKWRMQKRKQSFNCRQEKKEEAAMHRKQAIAAWRPCGNNSWPWEQMELRLLYKGSKGKWEQHKGRCHEEKKEEGMVKMNKSKAGQISNWDFQRKAGALKAHQRAVWSLIFIVFGVHLMKAEVPETQAHKGTARDVHPDLDVGTPWMRQGMMLWEKFVALSQTRKRKTARVKGPKKPFKKTVREGAPIPQKETARTKTQGPLKKTARVRTQGSWLKTV